MCLVGWSHNGTSTAVGENAFIHQTSGIVHCEMPSSNKPVLTCTAGSTACWNGRRCWRCDMSCTGCARSRCLWQASCLLPCFQTRQYLLLLLLPCRTSRCLALGCPPCHDDAMQNHIQNVPSVWVQHLLLQHLRLLFLKGCKVCEGA